MEVSLEMLVALGRIPPREREIVVNHVVTGETLQRIGDRLGISKERARQIERRGLERLRVELERLGER